MSDISVMNRRELLRRAVVLVGGVGLGSATLELLAREDAAKQVFSASQYALLKEVVDIIIPRTDTPGAVDAGVPALFDSVMRNWASHERQEQFRALLQQIDQAAVVHGGEFLALERARRIEVLVAFDQAQMSDKVYKKFKELVLTLFYLSEVGATQELQYEHTPGRWVASVKITPDTRGSAI
jgi:gluconate 2-dehydrogenase gamma chain